MTKDSTIVLFSTEHCALCEAALDLLFSMPELQGLALDVVDVALDDGLIQRYGERLPVVRIGQQELDWPFGTAQICRALKAV